MDEKEKILERLSEAVLKYDEKDAHDAAIIAVDHKIDATEAILEGLVKGMKKAGELFKNQVYYVPEILLCSDAMEEGLKILRPHVKKESAENKKGSIILGTIEGDIHSIGKNLVKLMLDTNGFEVYDLGEDVPIDRFVEEYKKLGTDLVGISTLMTTGLLAVQKAIPVLKDSDPNISILVGGAPFTLEIAKQFGADGFAHDAVSAVVEAERLMAIKS